MYKQSLGQDPGAPEAVTSKDGKQRFADGVVDEQRSRLVAVCEDHSGEGEAINTISAVGEHAVAEVQPTYATQLCAPCAAGRCKEASHDGFTHSGQQQ